MSWVSGHEMPYVGPCDRHTHMYGVIWCQARCLGASGHVTKSQMQSWQQAPSCSVGLAPGAIAFWSWQHVACCPQHHEAMGSSWLCIKNTAEKGLWWGAWSPGSDHYGPRVCRKGTHCCQCLLFPHLCPQPWEQEAASSPRWAGEQWAEISLGRAGRKGLSLFLSVHLYPGCVLSRNTQACTPTIFHSARNSYAWDVAHRNRALPGFPACLSRSETPAQSWFSRYWDWPFCLPIPPPHHLPYEESEAVWAQPNPGKRVKSQDLNA